MRIDRFKTMMDNIRNEIDYLRSLPGPVDVDGMIGCVTNMVIFNYFWNDKTDMPTCDYDKMQLAIQNTVRHLLRD